MAVIDNLTELLVTPTKDGGVPTNAQDMRIHQFGLPLQHYAQQYLFGATGLRLRVFHSIAGPPACCKSPLLFDLMGHICARDEEGGLGGLGVLYELEDKISPSLFYSVLKSHGQGALKYIKTMQNLTLEGAITHMNKALLGKYAKVAPKRDVPVVVGYDSIGGAASESLAKKMLEEGAVGKGFHDKAHIVKNLCEQFSKCSENVPVVVITVNQEKEKVSSTPGYSGPPQRQITGGVSQIFKDGHMISATAKALASGDGKLITMRTTKTSFCDPRKIEVKFAWNKFGHVTAEDDDPYHLHFEWAMATAKCLADPEKGVGEIRDIADVKISEAGLVTCPQLNCKSVKPEEFEAALFADTKVLHALYLYQKIDILRSMSEYPEYVANILKGNKKSDKESITVADAKKPAAATAALKVPKATKQAKKTVRAAAAPAGTSILEYEGG